MNERRLPWLIGFVLVCYLAMLGLIGMAALASAPQTPPEPASAHGCAVILPLPDGADGSAAVLQVRTTRPLSECDGSAPVSYGASVRDSGTGRAR